MKVSFIRKEYTPVLELFFAGWGMDPHLFDSDNLPSDSDFCICYDYSDLSLNLSLFSNYQAIHVTAWSMGVWAAAMVLQNSGLPIVKSRAVNGTHTPIHDLTGIPTTIFEGTLQHLSEKTLDKFYLRMCGNRNARIRFESYKSERSLESLRTELTQIKILSTSSQIPYFGWDLAVISNNDLIFPADNQRNAWNNTPILETNESHYPLNFFK